MGDGNGFRHDVRGASGALSAVDATQIQSLAAAYVLRTDRPGVGQVADLFTEDGVLTLGSMRIAGRDAVAHFFARRNEDQAAARRVTRHISGSVALVSRGRDRVVGHSTTIVFAGTGDCPLPAGMPSTICDFDDIYVKTSGGWLFEERCAVVIFTGAGAAAFAK